MNRLAIVFVVSVILAIVGAIPVQAHVLVADDSNTKAAIIHIMPDDDAVAGVETTIYFDTQEGLLRPTSQVSMSMAQAGESSKPVAVSVKNSLITASVIFQTRDVYTLTYTIDTEGDQTVFVHTLRVSKGSGVSNQAGERHVWAEGLLVASGVLVIGLGVVAFNRRRSIARLSGR